MKVSVQIVNSFVANNNGGNPAGVVLNSDSLSSHQMQKIAKQVGLSETAFVGKSKSAELELKFFTPVDEVDLCGHATIASWFTMFSNGEINPGQHTQLTRSGKLKIVVEQSGMVSMELAKPIFEQRFQPRRLQMHFGWINQA